jgi:hypothetical protein
LKANESGSKERKAGTKKEGLDGKRELKNQWTELETCGMI